MYLALIPDADSLAALRRFAPSLPSDAHVTIIHSKAQSSAPLAGPYWSHGMTLKTNGVAVFGGRSKVLVLRLNVLNAELTANLAADLCLSPLSVLRTQAETILRDAGLSWSKEWPFSPHVTLGPPIYGLLGEAPATLRFDRMEWR